MAFETGGDERRASKPLRAPSLSERVHFGAGGKEFLSGRLRGALSEGAIESSSDARGTTTYAPHWRRACGNVG